MKFRIDLSSFHRTEEIKRVADPSVNEEWANRILETAKGLCNDHYCKRIKLVKTGHTDIGYKCKDPIAIDCITKSIRTHIPSMPRVQCEYFKTIITALEREKTKFKT